MTFNRIRTLYRRIRHLLKLQYMSLRSVLQGMPPISTSRITDTLIRRYVDNADPVILEVGCHDGGNTIGFLNMFANPHVYCFEPDPRAIARFRERIGQRTNVHLFEVAVSDRIGQITFYQSSRKPDTQDSTSQGDWDRSGSIRKPKKHLTKHPWVTFDKSLVVNTTTLDAWCAQQGIDHVDFIWMDVQGAEMDVFNGGTQTLQKTRFLYTEYNNQELYEGQANLKQLVDYLTQFKVLIRYSDDVLLKNTSFQKSKPY